MPTPKIRKEDIVDQDISFNATSGLETGNASEINKTHVREKYNIQQTTYPEGLGVDPDKQHYIVFYINQRQKSKFSEFNPILNKKTEILDQVKLNKNSNRLDPDKTGLQAKRGLALATGGAAGLTKMISDIGSGEISAGSILKGSILGLGGFKAAEALIDENKSDLFKPDKIQRISDAIVLHIQDRPVTRHNVNYEERELGVLGGLLGGGVSATDGMEDAAFNDDVTQAVTRGITSAIPAVLGTRAEDLLEIGTKQISNPFREQFFKSVDFRTHNFRYTFMAKSQTEAKNIRHIIKLFKFHMHPELTGTGLSFIYPSEFDIKYYFRDRENKAFDRITSCVLTNMNIEYGGDIFSTFKDGQPVEVNMSLEFRELELLTKKRIAEGY